MNINDNKTLLLQTGEEFFGAHGFTKVGLAEILKKTGIPKGSFYYYFRSKEDYGVEVIKYYLNHYTNELQRLFEDQTIPAKDRLLSYWQSVIDQQSINNCEGRCLIVKLSSEVSDYSDNMRQSLYEGTEHILSLITHVIQAGQQDSSIPTHINPSLTAQLLYQQWLGASLIVQIEKKITAFELAKQQTLSLLNG